MASLHVRLSPFANGNANMAITYDENGKQTRAITERKKLAQLGPDYEMDREILDARMNKKAREDAGKDMLLDEILNRKKNKKGKA